MLYNMYSDILKSIQFNIGFFLIKKRINSLF